jgi:hypothetical protein
MIAAMNSISDTKLFFVMVMFLLIADVFTHNANTAELAKMLAAGYAGYMTGKATAPEVPIKLI